MNAIAHVVSEKRIVAQARERVTVLARKPSVNGKLARMEPTVYGASETLGAKKVSDHFGSAGGYPRLSSSPRLRAMAPRLFSRDFF